VEDVAWDRPREDWAERSTAYASVSDIGLQQNRSRSLVFRTRVGLALTLAGFLLWGTTASVDEPVADLQAVRMLIKGMRLADNQCHL
jgi:hypothetical protein